MTIREIRELTGLSMNKFCARYHIPPRTLQDWEYGKNEPAEYLVDLLERAVRQDFGLPRWYEVIVTARGDEFVEAKTYSRADAIEAAKMAWYHLSPSEQKSQTIEIRIYEDEDWLEDEALDFDVVSEFFRHDDPQAQ